MNIFFPIVYTCIDYNPPMNSVKFSSGSNLKWWTSHHFCLLKLTKYWIILSVRMNISNTNEYLFPIIYTCIYFNPRMNPQNLHESFYLVGDTIVLAISLFIMYTTPLSSLLRKAEDIKHHPYADDTHIHNSFNTYSFNNSIHNLQNSLVSVQDQMYDNKLNPDKTEFLLIGNKHHRKDFLPSFLRYPRQ